MKVVKEYVAIAALIAGSAAGGVALQNADAAAAPNCAPVTFGVGGSADPSSTHLPTAPGYTPVPWPAPRIPSDESQAAGRASLTAAIDAAERGCPGRKITVTGYSAGAKVAGDVCEVRSEVQCNLIADPRRPGGIESNYPSLLPGYTNAGPRPVKSNISQTCASHDWVCDSPNVLTDPVGAVQSLVGGFTNRHMDYYKGPQEPAAPAQESPVPTPKQVLEPVVQAVVPDVPIRDEYVPTPIAAYAPPVLKPVVDLLPPEVKNWTPPPLPALPHIPGIN